MLYLLTPFLYCHFLLSFSFFFLPLVTRLGVVTRDRAPSSELDTPPTGEKNSAGEWEDWGSILEGSVSLALAGDGESE